VLHIGSLLIQTPAKGVGKLAIAVTPRETNR
jgi:hypothetical protein